MAFVAIWLFSVSHYGRLLFEHSFFVLPFVVILIFVSCFDTFITLPLCCCLYDSCPEILSVHIDAPQTQNLNMLTCILAKQPSLSLFFLFLFITCFISFSLHPPLFFSYSLSRSLCSVFLFFYYIIQNALSNLRTTVKLLLIGIWCFLMLINHGSTLSLQPWFSVNSFNKFLSFPLFVACFSFFWALSSQSGFFLCFQPLYSFTRHVLSFLFPHYFLNQDFLFSHILQKGICIYLAYMGIF